MDNQDVVALLPPGYGAYFTPDELRHVGAEPYGDHNVFRCRTCGWSTAGAGFGMLVPHFISMRGVREVVEHWKREHG